MPKLLQVGVTFPQLEIGADPGGVRAYAEAVRDLGYEHIMAYDHVVGADPAGHPGYAGGYDYTSLFHEPFVLYGFLAAIVPDLELATGVIILPQRQTALVAKQAAEVDVLMRGRFRLGVGTGWNAVEYDALGMDFHTRGRRLEEQIVLLRKLWAEETVTFEGRFDRITSAGLNPLPSRREIPIWIGGSAEAALRRAARVADGYFTQRPLPGGWATTFDLIRTWVREAGRDPEQFGIEARIDGGGGTPDEWRAAHEEWQALGASHVSVNTMKGGLVGPDAHIQRLREIADALSLRTAGGTGSRTRRG
jgi:probable F420-dependent oxidoreductase